MKAFKVYPISPGEQKELDDFLEENQQSGCIHEFKSPWSSSFFFVKKDGILRPVQDYRKLNSVMMKNAYPLPIISNVIGKLRRACWFSKMDVCWGFNNICIREGNEHKAAFLMNCGLFELTVMFFRLCNSPSTFQTMMNNLLHDLIIRGVVIVYVDDILVYTTTLEEHQKVVMEVLKILKNLFSGTAFSKQVMFILSLTTHAKSQSWTNTCQDWLTNCPTCLPLTIAQLLKDFV